MKAKKNWHLNENSNGFTDNVVQGIDFLFGSERNFVKFILFRRFADGQLGSCIVQLILVSDEKHF